MLNRFTDLLITAIAMCIATGAVAQIYPTKPIRIIIPTAPGGNPDFIARPIAQKMSEAMKQAIVIDNRPGAAGIIGVEFVARAAPDGYTILFGAIGHVATPSALHAKLAFDAIKDFAPITLIGAGPVALGVRAGLAARSVQELVALAKARPGQLNYASFGIGSFTHFVTEALSASVGIKMVHVPYKGSAPAAAALLSGEVVMSFDALQATLPQVQAKRLHALAIGATRRAPIAPDIPTFAEAGFPEITASAWFGLFAPANTPRDIVVKLHAEAVRALASPEIRDQFERTGIEPVGNTPEEFAAIVRSDIAKFTKIAKDAGIRAE